MSEKRKNSEDGKLTVPDGKADDDGKGEKLEGMSEEEEEEEAEDMKETSPAAGEDRQKEE